MWPIRNLLKSLFDCLSLYFVPRTLQELLTPNNVRFYDHGLHKIGSKIELVDEIAAITGIPESLLNGSHDLGDFSIAPRMSWASHRKTTREGALLRREASVINIG